MPEPDQGNSFLETHACLLLGSYRQLTGRELLSVAVPVTQAGRMIYHAPFAVLSHDNATDPVFTYANLKAQELFEMPWRQIVGMPSRYSAEPLLREERQALLERVARHGYIDDYQGVRISRTGLRFRISRSTVWNLIDDNRTVIGQAASIGSWQPLPGNPDR